MIGIIGFESLRVMQYLDKYTKIFDEDGIDYEVVYWNRNGIPNFDSRYQAYNKTMNTYVPFQKKIPLFLGYASFIYRTILSRRYDQLIVLTTQSAIVLSPLLLTKYRKKYLFDYRDITFERNRGYRFLVKSLFRHSKGVPISSLGFLNYLGKGNKYILSHNCRDLQFIEYDKRKSDKIRIVYWGMVRQVDFNKKICDLFANDDRFTLTYHGEGYYKEIEEYCQVQDYKNILFTGGYERTEMMEFGADTDILLNAYENDGQQQSALTVKLYDGMKYRIPMLVTSGSYMADYLSSWKIAYPISVDKAQSKEEIINWFQSLSKNSIQTDFNELKDTMKKDEEVFIQSVRKFYNQGKVGWIEEELG
ncbi:MAG TPA: hypothetical protein H9946_10500 [Candidatus Jeotgalibaca pullicola]|nr:hypothetical protein [Candidatus Jeotgalibaca pullicola]